MKISSVLNLGYLGLETLYWLQRNITDFHHSELSQAQEEKGNKENQSNAAVTLTGRI